MTPTTPLAGVVFGLVAGLLVVLVVMAVLYVPWRRPAKVRIPTQAWTPTEVADERR